ncbi:hypothetical protein [Wolbachia endosymbiont of Armadillidium arcangelii]|uniref:Uncharacterized protein n=1 Tax=Wolbachia endosymbiont of Armadillidium arcangelii TaxID=3158571 RepID=A0AAU7Q1E0_9RICK
MSSTGMTPFLMDLSHNCTNIAIWHIINDQFLALAPIQDGVIPVLDTGI